MEYLGINGLIVILPCKWTLVSSPGRRLFTVQHSWNGDVKAASYSNAQKKSDKIEKQLNHDQNSTSFILSKGKSVIMPFIENTAKNTLER